MQCRFQASATAGYERIAANDTGLKYFGEHGILGLDGADRFEDDTGPNEDSSTRCRESRRSELARSKSNLASG